jgi:hypothetical protein
LGGFNGKVVWQSPISITGSSYRPDVSKRN